METSRILYNINEDSKALRTEVFIEEQNVPVELELEADEDKYVHCCIYREDVLIAYARVKLSNPAIIGRVCVKKSYRGLGFGRKVMELAEGQIPLNTDIVLHAQMHAKEFYKSLGYEKVGQIFIEANIKHIEMSKKKA